MPSSAYSHLAHRMGDIKQLIDAHEALTKFQRAQSAASNANMGLEFLTKIVNSLVSAPGKGRRTEVDALNRAAFVLLSAHFQGYIEDLHAEAGNLVLAGRVRNPADIVKQAKPRSQNPHPNVIEQMFGGIGLFEILDELAWQRASNDSIRKRLTGYIEIRNKIAHGTQLSITKAQVLQFKQFVEIFAREFDADVGQKIHKATGSKHW